MKTLPSGPFADAINKANTTIAQYNRQLAATEGEITDAMAKRDVDAMMALRAKRDALASLVTDMARDRDALHAKRLAAIQQEAIDQREAAFAELPERETYIDTDGKTTITRARIRI